MLANMAFTVANLDSPGANRQVFCVINSLRSLQYGGLLRILVLSSEVCIIRDARFLPGFYLDDVTPARVKFHASGVWAQIYAKSSSRANRNLNKIKLLGCLFNTTIPFKDTLR